MSKAEEMALRELKERHAKLMSKLPYPHDGWVYCRCYLAAKIRAALDAKEKR